MHRVEERIVWPVLPDPDYPFLEAFGQGYGIKQRSFFKALAAALNVAALEPRKVLREEVFDGFKVAFNNGFVGRGVGCRVSQSDIVFACGRLEYEGAVVGTVIHDDPFGFDERSGKVQAVTLVCWS